MTGSLVSSLLSRGGGSGGGGVPMSKVIVKSNTLPTAEIKYVGAMYIYAGETTSAYKHGYIYEGTSTPANTKTVSFSPNTISCTGENFWAFWKSEDGAPNNYTEIVKGEMVFVGGNTWNLIGRNTNNEIVKSYQQYNEDWEALGFTFTGTFSEGDTVYFDCAINETDDIIYWWQRIDVQPAGASSSTGIAVDDQLSFDSQNPVQNKVITEALEETGYDTWKKPADWIDIRSGAMPNSIYLLVGHKADYSALNNFGFNVVLSNASNSFNVYIDYQLYGTYTSGTDVKISWSALALTSGQTTTTPIELTTHIVRITPAQSTDTIVSYDVRRVAASGHEEQGILWAHFEVDYALSKVLFARYNQRRNTYLTAITALGDLLHISGDDITCLIGGEAADRYSYRSNYLAKLPTIEVDSVTNAGGAFNHSGPLKKIKLIVNNSFSQGNSATFGNMVSGNTSDFEINKPIVLSNGPGANSLFQDSNLKTLPSVNISNAENLTTFLTNNTNLKDTVFDATDGINLTRLTMYGTSAKRMDGLKGLIVSNQAPFNNATSPQINVSYTGLDRVALVNLFKSMPYNVGYSVVGSPTIVDGVASGFSSSNYLVSSESLNVADYENLEFYVRCKTPAEFVNSTWTNYITNGTTVNNAGRTLGIYKGSSYVGFNVFGTDMATYTVTADTWYRVKLVCTSDTQTSTIYNDDGTVFAGPLSATRNISNNKTLMMGGGTASNIGSFGQIDLNETYIKVNGVPWFGPGVTKNLVPGGTVVGSPTITNGIISGFSSSNYVKILNLPSGSFAGNIRAKLNSDATGFQSLFFLNSSTPNHRFSIENNAENSLSDTPDIRYYVYDTTTSSNKSYTMYNINLRGVWVDYNFIYNDTTHEITINIIDVSTQTVLNTVTYSNVSFVGGDINIGYYWQAFNGSIDLNNTYIKVGSDYIYRGMVPQVKTCSIVGCTGTADLTADDKAIATSKGWYLTVQ